MSILLLRYSKSTGEAHKTVCDFPKDVIFVGLKCCFDDGLRDIKIVLSTPINYLIYSVIVFYGMLIVLYIETILDITGKYQR